MTTATALLVDPAVVPSVPYAGWARRVLASLLDAAVLSAVAWLSTGATLGWDAAIVVWGWSGEHRSSWWIVAAYVGMLVLQACTGRTPGKQVAGVVVVRERDGRPVGILGTVGRTLAHLIDAILFIGYLRPLWDARRRTFADSIACSVALVSASRWTSGPRRSRVAAIAATVAVAGALTLVLTPATVTSAGATSCRVPGGVELDGLWWDVAPGVETRLGITRTRPDVPEGTVEWSTSTTVPAEDGTQLEVLAGDGQVVGSATFDAGTLADDYSGSEELTIPTLGGPADVDALPASARLVRPDGTVVELCATKDRA